MPALCLFAQLLLQVFLFNPDKIGLVHTTHGNSFGAPSLSRGEPAKKAEGVGFEPTRGFLDPHGLANRSVRPLRHPSAFSTRL